MNASIASRPRTIWVVNDEDCVLQAEAMILRQGFPHVTLRLFGEGVTAWEALQHDRPDLLITDDAMPAIRGQEIAERLHERGDKFPVMVTSPFEPTQEWVNALAAQGMCIEWLALPMDLGEFLDRVAALLGETRG